MKVLMVCSGGMSSAIVVKAIKQAAEKEGYDLDIQAVGTREFENELPHFDLGLVAPQVKHQYKELKAIGDKLNKPVELIPPMGYTPIGAPKVLEMIKQVQL